MQDVCKDIKDGALRPGEYRFLKLSFGFRLFSQAEKDRVFRKGHVIFKLIESYRETQSAVKTEIASGQFQFSALSPA
jgi:hypothetical protein